MLQEDSYKKTHREVQKHPVNALLPCDDKNYIEMKAAAGSHAHMQLEMHEMDSSVCQFINHNVWAPQPLILWEPPPLPYHHQQSLMAPSIWVCIQLIVEGK